MGLEAEYYMILWVMIITTPATTQLGPRLYDTWG